MSRVRKSSVEVKWCQPKPRQRRLFPYRDIEILAIRRLQAELRRQLAQLSARKRHLQRGIYIAARRLDPEFRKAEGQVRRKNQRQARAAARERSKVSDLNDAKGPKNGLYRDAVP